MAIVSLQRQAHHWSVQKVGAHVNSPQNHNTSQLDDGRACGYAATLVASDYIDATVFFCLAKKLL